MEHVSLRRSLDETFAGEIVRRGDPGYDAARVVWNGTIDRRPELVAYATGADDVVEAVRFAREAELPVAVRSGGHSIPGFSTCDDGCAPTRSQCNARSRSISIRDGSSSGW